ncbi:MAG TPA: tRNA (adenosine(37)-N6)-threonylcarbamoyltransferase complex ATPase subunit type 1 TsaE [Hyphomicrobiaceae bacterium]|jgi:tRNA threonylcarbamoyl adenosine modification protein YjeE|nr:tRNA (adenosine(37)-N6)-threonylcarbamoyltransferase complex ATPase subunit type 1 TsaE [Hyphomicrobiaceae bacterium]
MTSSWQRELDEAGVARLAELLALRLTIGSLVVLKGELGAGKTTFARALIRALLDADVEVPSPTFSLQQTYATPRLTVTHFDFYRLGSAEEALELGFEDALQRGAVLAEWAERIAPILPEERYEIELTDTEASGRRRVLLRGLGGLSDEARRLGAALHLLDQEPRARSARLRYLQGDASTRTYARLRQAEQPMLLMDAPRQADGPPVRDGKSYSQIAHLAEDMVRPFVAIGAVLTAAGLSAPRVLASDLAHGLALVEDLGDRLFAAEIAAGTPQAELYRSAVDALVRLRSVPVPSRLPLPDGSSYSLPRRDRAAFEIELELLLDWYWPALKGAACPPAVREEFRALWSGVLDRLLALPGAWFLRDFHSPNLIWLPERHGVARVGILDFQDALNEHPAFDLVSLLQDARLDVPAALERDLFHYYCARAQEQEASFDRRTFAAAYAMFGAQRNTRLLGLWVRLLRRDGKPHYLQHIPRTWGYLDRNLGDAAMAALAPWYARHFPADLRAGLPG